MTRYFEFPTGGGSWVKETVDRTNSGDLLTRRQYTGDPRVESDHARLDNVTQFNAETEELATRMRQGFVLANGQVDWQNWEPV
ncbi:hypothetical protein [Curtobacterium poinsettiae]|uniref:Uncharacterized protein n=1 Tax=Curtobacterium poinsettiae TaxID=159612 RepID=A0A9Q9P853_9MICO|nr:hypothetical protein [Curtobacterium flaccumfaciens]UYC81403.1 hypothetical protein OE229_02770 [Curtobacterium flaccumfaciens pv. poinsettiae]